MTKSSEVLRLAAEYALSGNSSPVSNALFDSGIEPPFRGRVTAFLFILGYWEAKYAGDEIDCIGLSLAAAIAESEGD